MGKSAFAEAARAELIAALSEARLPYGLPGTRDVDVTAWNQRIDRARAALAADEAREPVAWVDDLSRPQPHCVTDLRYCSAAQRERGEHLKYVPLYGPPAPAAQTEQPAQKDAIDRAFDEGYAAGKASMLPHLSRLNDELAAVVSVYAARVAAEQPARGLVTEADSAVLEALGTITLWLELNDGVAQLGWIASVEEPHTEPPDFMHGTADLDDVLVEFRQNHGLDGLAELEQLFLRGISKAREISL